MFNVLNQAFFFFICHKNINCYFLMVNSLFLALLVALHYSHILSMDFSVLPIAQYLLLICGDIVQHSPLYRILDISPAPCVSKDIFGSPDNLLNSRESFIVISVHLRVLLSLTYPNNYISTPA